MAIVVITGASGLVGGHLRAALEARGDTVRPLSLRTPAVDPAVLEGADAVVNLAGSPVSQRWSAKGREAILASRRDGTRRLVDAIGRLERRPAVLVNSSAVGVYGDRGDEVLTEASTVGSGFLTEVCTAWEQEARRVEEFGVRGVQLRCGIVFSRDADAYRRLLQPAKLGMLGPMGSGRQWWSWIHIDDAVGLYTAAIDDPRYTGAVNATAQPIQQRELVRGFGRLLHRPSFVPAPAFALKLLLGGFASELLGSRRVVPERAQALAFPFRYPEFEAALQALLG
jgi:uncharacterized protein (TIGR01777 family)